MKKNIVEKEGKAIATICAPNKFCNISGQIDRCKKKKQKRKLES